MYIAAERYFSKLKLINMVIIRKTHIVIERIIVKIFGNLNLIISNKFAINNKQKPPINKVNIKLQMSIGSLSIKTPFYKSRY